MMHLGWISILLASLAGAVTMRLWPMNPRRSYSENIARRKSSRWVFAVWMSVVTVLFYWFLLGWLGPDRQMGAEYYGIIGLMAVFQLTLAWVPATQGRAMLIHNITSYGLVLLMPVMFILLVITANPELMVAQRLAVGCFMVYQMAVIYAFFFLPKARSYFLWFQLSLMVMAWAAILIIAYG